MISTCRTISNCEHGPKGQRPWVPARDIIDWSIPATSIFRRKKPLVDNTLRRIEAGIKKFWGAWAEPFLVILRGTSTGHLEKTVLDLKEPLPTVTAGWNHVGLVEPVLLPQLSCGAVRGMDQPVPTITTAGAHALVEPFLATIAHGNPAGNFDRRVHSIDAPCRTITGAGDQAIIEPFLSVMNNWPSQQDGYALDRPLPSLTTSNHVGLVEPFLISYYGNDGCRSIHEPFATITTRDRFGLVVQYGLDILFRMLHPRELARAHSFPDDYEFTGTKTDIVKQIGNSVPSKTSEALCFAALADSA